MVGNSLKPDDINDRFQRQGARTDSSFGAGMGVTASNLPIGLSTNRKKNASSPDYLAKKRCSLTKGEGSSQKPRLKTYGPKVRITTCGDHLADNSQAGATYPLTATSATCKRFSSHPTQILPHGGFELGSIFSGNISESATQSRLTTIFSARLA